MILRKRFTLFADEIEANKGVGVQSIIEKRFYNDISKEFDLELHIALIDKIEIDMESINPDIIVNIWYFIDLNYAKVRELEEISERLEVGL